MHMHENIEKPIRRYNKIMKLDWFGKDFNFRLPGGKKQKQSCHGVCVTVFIIFLVIFYAAMQFFKLKDYQDPSIMVSTRDAHFDQTYEFTEESGMKVAFAITAYDSN